MDTWNQELFISKLRIAEILLLFENTTDSQIESIYLKASKILPERPEPFSYLSTFFRKKDKFDECIRYGLEALKLKPDINKFQLFLDLSAYEEIPFDELCVCFYWKEEYEKALPFCEKYEKLQPSERASANIKFTKMELEKLKNKKPVKLVANIIMKNEEEVIIRCLESVKEVVDEFVLCDTGSNDKTVEIAENWLKENKKKGKVVKHKWKDFSWNRNLCLKEIEADPNSTIFGFILDADMRLEKGTGFEWKNNLKPGHFYMVNQKMSPEVKSINLKTG